MPLRQPSVHRQTCRRCEVSQSSRIPRKPARLRSHRSAHSARPASTETQTPEVIIKTNNVVDEIASLADVTHQIAVVGEAVEDLAELLPENADARTAVGYLSQGMWLAVKSLTPTEAQKAEGARPPTMSELAAKTADEIERRGLRTGGLARVGVAAKHLTIHCEDGSTRGYVADEDVADCQVCTLGGMGAAFYGNPTKGYWEDQNGYDTFVISIANRLILLGECASRKTPVISAYDAQTVIYGWNDRVVDGDIARVVAFFRSASADWAAEGK